MERELAERKTGKLGERKLRKRVRVSE